MRRNRADNHIIPFQLHISSCAKAAIFSNQLESTIIHSSISSVRVGIYSEQVRNLELTLINASSSIVVKSRIHQLFSDISGQSRNLSIRAQHVSCNLNSSGKVLPVISLEVEGQLVAHLNIDTIDRGSITIRRKQSIPATAEYYCSSYTISYSISAQSDSLVSSLDTRQFSNILSALSLGGQSDLGSVHRHIKARGNIAVHAQGIRNTFRLFLKCIPSKMSSICGVCAVI